MAHSIELGDHKVLVPVPLVMVKFKVVIGVTKAKVTVRLAVVVAGVAKPVEEEDQSALAAAGTTEQTVQTIGAMQANQTAMFALVHGLEPAVHLLHLHHLHHQPVQRQPPQHAFGTALEELVLVPLCEGLNQCIAIAMPCLLLLQTIHMELSFTEVLLFLQA